MWFRSCSFLFFLAACHGGDVRQLGSFNAVDNQTGANLSFDAVSDINRGQIQTDCVNLQADVDASGLLVLTGPTVVACTVDLAPQGVSAITLTGNGDLDSTGTWEGLASVDVRGNGRVALATVTTDSLDLAAAGTGDVSIGMLTAQDLGLVETGDGDVTLAGSAAAADVSISGNGDLYAQDLVVTDLTIDVSGNGSAECTATGTADVTVTGSGQLDLWGGAEVTANVPLEGSGLIIH